MYNLMVVDDEKIYREGVSRIIRGLGDFNVFNASNGKQALKIIENNSIHGLILDISMPIMNGIELLEELDKRRMLHMAIVVLSGHDEFEYAQKALQYRAMDFILKPIIRQKVIEICDKMRERLEFSLKREKEIQLLKQQVKESRALIYERFLMDILSGKVDQQGYKDRTEFLDISYRGPYFRIALLEVENEDGQIQYRTEEERQVFLKKVENAIKEAMKIQKLPGASLFHNHTEYFVYFCNGNEEEKEEHLTIHEGLKNIKEMVQTKADACLTIGLGNLVKGVENIVVTYNQAKTALGYKILMGCGNIFCLSDFEHNISDIDLNVDMEEINLFIRTEQKDKILENIDFVFNKLKEANNKPDLSRVFLFCDKYASALISVLEDQGINISEFYNASNNPMIDIKSKKSLRDLENWLKDLVNKVHTKIIKSRSGKYVSIVAKVKHYLQEEYRNDINYTSLGEVFGYSANYLGQIFKKQTSLTINEYIRNVRIMNAKKLLKNSDLRIFEIANEVGFSDQQYFCSVFRKSVGVTPSEYREI